MTENNQLGVEWIGQSVVDLSGEKIGTVESVRPGAVGDATWLVVKRGQLGATALLVPASEARLSPAGITLPYTKERVEDSPVVEDGGAFGEAEEGRLCRYFGLEYLGSATEPAEGCGHMKDAQDYRAAG